jgi:hypothetical protein
MLHAVAAPRLPYLGWLQSLNLLISDIVSDLASPYPIIGVAATRAAQKCVCGPIVERGGIK